MYNLNFLNWWAHIGLSVLRTIHFNTLRKLQKCNPLRFLLSRKRQIKKLQGYIIALISRKSPQKTFSLTKTKMFLYTVIYTTKKLDLLVLIWRQWRHRLVLEIIAYIKQYTAYSVIYKTKYFFLQRPIPSNILSSIYESIKYKNYLHLIYIHKR